MTEKKMKDLEKTLIEMDIHHIENYLDYLRHNLNENIKEDNIDECFYYNTLVKKYKKKLDNLFDELYNFD